MRNESGLTPMEYNCVVRMDPVESKSAGGIILPTSKTDRDKLAADEGMLVAISPLAFNYDQWPADARKPQVGDRVMFARYSGTLYQPNGEDKEPQYRILKDKDIIAVIEQPPALAAVA